MSPIVDSLPDGLPQVLPQVLSRVLPQVSGSVSGSVSEAQVCNRMDVCLENCGGPHALLSAVPDCEPQQFCAAAVRDAHGVLPGKG